jgi:hypothetical protein
VNKRNANSTPSNMLCLSRLEKLSCNKVVSGKRQILPRLKHQYKISYLILEFLSYWFFFIRRATHLVAGFILHEISYYRLHWLLPCFLVLIAASFYSFHNWVAHVTKRQILPMLKHQYKISYLILEFLSYWFFFIWRATHLVAGFILYEISYHRLHWLLPCFLVLIAVSFYSFHNHVTNKIIRFLTCLHVCCIIVDAFFMWLPTGKPYYLHPVS